MGSSRRRDGAWEGRQGRGRGGGWSGQLGRACSIAKRARVGGFGVKAVGWLLAMAA